MEAVKLYDDARRPAAKTTINNYFIGMDVNNNSRYTEYEDKVARSPTPK